MQTIFKYSILEDRKASMLIRVYCTPRSILFLFRFHSCTNSSVPPPIKKLAYNSDFPVAFSINLFKILVLLVKSSNFSGANPPFFIMPSNLANSLEA